MAVTLRVAHRDTQRHGTVDSTETTIATTVAAYSQKELEWMAITIYREAGGDACSDETRIMVGNVVLNRVASPSFPNTIYDVLTQPGQYAGVYDDIRWPVRAELPEERHAVARAYRCAERVLEGETLLPPNVVYQSNFRTLGSGVYKTADGMFFNYE